VMVEKFARTAKKKNTIFIVNIKLIMKEKDEVVENMAKLLKEYKDVFLGKLPPDLSLRRREDDYVILTIPGVRL
jgi:hypothetical protein